MINRRDAIDALFEGLAAAAAEQRAQRKAQREAKRNRPEAVAARKAAAQRGWETRRQQAEEKAHAQALDDWSAPTGPTCGEMTHDSRGAEVFCYLEPGHDDAEHDNGDIRWPRDENESEIPTSALYTEVWDASCAPGGYVCGAPDPTRPDGQCGMPVESEPCPEHAPAEAVTA